MGIRIYLVIEYLSNLNLLSALQFSSKSILNPLWQERGRGRGAEPDLGVIGDLSGPVGLLCHWLYGSFPPASGIRGGKWGLAGSEADLSFLNPQRAGDGLAPLDTVLTP